MITLKTTLGDIVIELNPEKAPVTCANFEKYVKSGFYNGTIFHRVIKGFMIQGGGLLPDLSNKRADAPIKNEADNGLKNEPGTIAMARTNDPHSATSQFFINTVNNDFLNFRSKDARGWGYAVFGKVVSGMDVVKKIESVATGSKSFYDDVPLETIEIKEAVAD
jgi:peptidyl-prolyl cis-trans isomerase B (cyclophilin B)